VLSRAHSTPVGSRQYSPTQSKKKNILTSNTVQDVLVAAQEPINNVVEIVGKLSLAASKMPYYKFNNMWSRQMQSAVCFGVDFSLHRLSTDKTAG
jgi:hypothetical protein